MNKEQIISDFLKAISSGNSMTVFVIGLVCKATKDFKENDVEITTYNVNENIYYILDSKKFKMVHGKGYNLLFDKETGKSIRFGDTSDDDPDYSYCGPEIADIEISLNGCPQIGGTNCAFCYKGNTSAKPTNMSFDTFKKLLSVIPKNLTQIAFGITGVKTNPDFPEMLAYCRENGIVPNFTTNGVDVEFIKEIAAKYCGALAVSCYPADPQLCYYAIKSLSEISDNLKVNMHLLVSPFTKDHCFKTLKDIKDGKVKGLNAVVFLRAKPVGRASVMKCYSADIYPDLIKYCVDNGIRFGADSCAAPLVIKTLKELNKDANITSIEGCESGKYSSYINVNGIYRCCSFCEDRKDVPGFDVLSLNSPEEFIEKWNSKELQSWRDRANKYLNVNASCPVYNLENPQI